MAKKQSAEEMWNTEFFQEHAHRAIQAAAKQLEEQMVYQFGLDIAECESPLEAAFGAWWSALGWIGTEVVHLHRQVEVEHAGETFRLDFVVIPGKLYDALRGDKHCPRIAIEVDGHEFHERSKEQVTRRNARDRALQSAGWTVWHFSGSEFHRDPRKVVEDARNESIRRFAQAMYTAGFWRR